MNTRDNLLKILGDLEQAGDKEDTLYSNIVKRLNKVLNNYLEELDSNYNTIVNNNDLIKVAKELIK